MTPRCRFLRRMTLAVAVSAVALPPAEAANNGRDEAEYTPGGLGPAAGTVRSVREPPPVSSGPGIKPVAPPPALNRVAPGPAISSPQGAGITFPNYIIYPSLRPSLPYWGPEQYRRRENRAPNPPSARRGGLSAPRPPLANRAAGTAGDDAASLLAQALVQLSTPSTLGGGVILPSRAQLQILYDRAYAQGLNPYGFNSPFIQGPSSQPAGRDPSSQRKNNQPADAPEADPMIVEVVPGPDGTVSAPSAADSAASQPAAAAPDAGNTRQHGLTLFGPTAPQPQAPATAPAGQPAASADPQSPATMPADATPAPAPGRMLIVGTGRGIEIVLGSGRPVSVLWAQTRRKELTETVLADLRKWVREGGALWVSTDLAAAFGFGTIQPPPQDKNEGKARTLSPEHPLWQDTSEEEVAYRLEADGVLLLRANTRTDKAMTPLLGWEAGANRMALVAAIRTYGKGMVILRPSGFDPQDAGARQFEADLTQFSLEFAAAAAAKDEPVPDAVP